MGDGARGRRQVAGLEVGDGLGDSLVLEEEEEEEGLGLEGVWG